MLEDLLTGPVTSGGAHTELRAQTTESVKVSVVSGNLIANAGGTAGGVCARVYKNGSWGFSSCADYDADSVRAVLKEARENGEFLDGKLNKGKAPLPEMKPYITDAPAAAPILPRKLYIDYAMALDAHIAKTYPKLSGRRVIVTGEKFEKLLCASNGTHAHTVAPRVYVYVFLSADTKDGETLELFDVLDGGSGYFPDYFTDPAQYYEKIDSLYNELMDKTEGIFPEAGTADVIMAPSLSGMLAHEAVGHTVEADLVIGGSVAGHNLGKEVASPLVNMVDFAHTALGKPCPLPVYVDDEGTACADEVLIKDGILVGYMNNLESAQRFDMAPRGNARAFAYSDEPLIRMRNTAVLPGKDKLEDMIASIDHGYLLTRTGNGQADTTGEFMFGVNMGYEIKNGKLGRALRDTTISGVAFEMLKTVSMVSDDLVWESSGYCGKKQPMPVGIGGPAVKCKVSIGGQ
ncbi:MAG: TldD/PmbA family protein [Clostridia bacterium]|nr:TldD/PmbA family protein [Clostridia bacterium]